MAGVKNRLSRVVMYLRAHTRVKHYRGHSIHSPFAYCLVREAFMKRSLRPDRPNRLYAELRKAGIGKYCAVQMQNMYDYCGYESYRFICKPEDITDSALCLALADVGNGELDELLNAAHTTRCTIGVISPRNSRGRLRVCEKYAYRNVCLSIDKRGFIAFFFGQPLTKQHFKL